VDNNNIEGAHSDDWDSGTLHEARSLSFRDQIAIVQYACHFRQVYNLVSPLWARLMTQYGQVEGAVLSTGHSKHCPKIKDADAISKRRKLQEAMDNLSANAQDEQQKDIQLVLTTFVYPMLL